MPLKFTFKKLPVDENGKSYDSLDDFKVHMLAELIHVDGDEAPIRQSELDCARLLVANSDAALEILQLNESARPSARGQKRPRKPKAPAAAQLPLGDKAA